MTIDQALKHAAAKLNSAKISLPRFAAEVLLSAIIKKPREFLLAHSEEKITAKQLVKFKRQIYRHLKGMPIAYLTGHKEFYSLDFQVNKNVLIPRPETELMVETALKLVAHNSRPATLIDIGTGSGCLIITLAKMLNHKFIAIDISPKALSVAKKNANFHGVNKKIKFIKGNLLEPILKNQKNTIDHLPLVVLANLPYLTKAQIKNSLSIKYEPRLALAAGADGLKYYAQLLRQLKIFKNTTALCEIDSGQTSKIKQLIRQQLPQASFQIKKDLASLNRLAVISV